MESVQLFRKNSLGIGTWKIWVQDVGSTHAVLAYSHAVTEGASEVEHQDLIELNKSGRNIRQQLALEMNSRIGRMRDKGYKDTREEAALGATSQFGLKLPMLALPIEKAGRFSIESESCFVQPKFDGHRCLITNQSGEILAYTRKGKPITTIGHVLQDFSWLPEGKTVDGELYVHGKKLQAISSLIKRQQDASSLLKYHWYDYVSDKPFADRYMAMRKARDRFAMPSVELVTTMSVGSFERVMEYFRLFREQGYEGAMLRRSLGGYQDGLARASQLLKVKERADCEVTVLGATPSREGWAVLRVRMDNGNEFDVSAPGSVPEKQRVMDEIEKFVGRRLTVEYAMLTDDGLPFHAVATRWFEEV